MVELAENLRRLLARQGLTLAELAESAEVDERTIRALLQGRNVRPHSRTLQRLAAGLGVDTDEFFRNSALEARRDFDRRTNPIVNEILEAQPRLFADWSVAELDELFSHFGEGGSLTRAGVMATIDSINRKREVQRKVALLLETAEADVLIGVVDLLYQRVAVR
jgi:transcriptional regulator with XRE-family HTH domain